MKSLLKLGLVVLAVAMLGCATTGKPRVAGVTPVQKLEFTDHVYYHNMGITWDGEYYYTVSGGNTDYSNLNRYDESGELHSEYDISADGRAILYSPAEEQLFVKSHGLSLEDVDLDLEETSTALDDIFTGEQSSVAISPDGEMLYELYEGTVNVFNADGDEEGSFELSSYNTTEELGYAFAIAASDKFLFGWAPESDTDILVYGLDGKYVTRFSLPRSGYGFSLSWANGLLWIADDADGSTDGADGTWYGYALKGLE
jgi:hypothetical protein